MRRAVAAVLVFCAGAAGAASLGARDGREGWHQRAQVIEPAPLDSVPDVIVPPLVPTPPPPAPAPTPVAKPPCGNLEDIFGVINLRVPLASTMPLPLRAAPQVRLWLSAVQPKILTEPYDLFFVLVHASGQVGVAAGWQKDPNTEQPSLCALTQITMDQYKDLRAVIKQREREEL